MEISPNSETKPRVRRRLIQSTLFPHKPQENVISIDKDIEPDVDQADDEDVKQIKKRKPRASKKAVVNGKEIGEKNANEEDSPVTVKVDFFAKVSERRSQRRKQKEPISVLSPEKIEQTCSPSDVITDSKSPRKLRKRASSTPKKRQASVTPEKWQKNSTPSRKANNGALNEGDLASPLKTIPDLRLEAKLTAEENSRIFAGKEVHPFFSSWKTGKKIVDSNGTENRWCHVQKKESNNDFSPVHIFENTQGETFSCDWKNWTFSESISTRASRNLEDTCLQLINEGSVNCLQFDNFCDIPPVGISLCQYNEVVREIGKGGDVSDNTEPVAKPDGQWQDALLSERMPSDYHDCSYQPVNSLWTTKYQPEKAIEICGNCESVKVLNEWLHSWYEKGSRTNKISTNNDNWIMQGVDLNYCPSDCGSDYSDDEETGLKNVLLVKGPVGSGKSAAIYACAKEQGFQIIEVNTSDWRNGSLVKQKFGEAVESQWLQCSSPNIKNRDNKSQLKSTPTTCNPEASQRSTGDVIELIPLSDDEDSKNLDGSVAKPVGSQTGTKILILFEDVDASLIEDRGFIATVQQLAETAKRPMILTSNTDDPDLPNNLHRIEVSFGIPSSKELLNLGYMVCKTEKTEVEPWLVERFIDYCQGDIRKTIMLLQFWCQGQNQSQIKDSDVRISYAPLVFDTNAGHRVLPHIIPSGYTSKLSEMIENEIAKSTLLIEEDASFMDIIEEEDEIDLETTHNIDAKKDEMLRRHCSDQDANDYIIATNDLPNFSRRTLQKKDLISSDSEPCWNEGLVDVTDDVNAQLFSEIKKSRRKYNVVSDSEEEYFDDGLCPADSKLPFEGENLDDTCHPSADVSCVPESSYVPETVIENGTIINSPMRSSGHVNVGIEDSPTNADCAPVTMVEEDKVSVMAVKDLCLDTAPVNEEEIGDSNNESMETIPRDYQMMDECSRIDFSRKAESSNGHKTLGSTDIVQETWRKLRNCRNQLSEHVGTEENDTLEALGIAYGMTNLISDADLLLADCQSLTCDYLKPAMFSNEKSHSYSWHDDQLHMSSTFAQHGFCLYAKKTFASESKNSKMDLAWEMLTASTNAISLGKMINQNMKMVKNLGNKKLQNGVTAKSMLESPLCSTVQSIVPLRAQLSLKGYVFHEYLSSLAQISSSESSRLSEAINPSSQRRKRVARNYLSNGGLSLSSEDISLLDQYSCYRKPPSKTKNES
ncbi:uncharacterized protein [Rutidosis leptorrhynchoides]|uniref:uncharacterized protein n=1 Tax=Rutidosis leptorrhynchoides TaxID=125765 RepID=UPI003A98FDE7